MGGWDECPSLGHLAGHGREREGDICGRYFGGSNWKCVEVSGSCKGLEFWKMEKLVVVEEGKK